MLPKYAGLRARSGAVGVGVKGGRPMETFSKCRGFAPSWHGSLDLVIIDNALLPDSAWRSSFVRSSRSEGG